MRNFDHKYIITMAVTLGFLSGACGMDTEPPDSPLQTSTTDDHTTVTEVTQPVLRPSGSDGNICTDKGPVMGTAQPGAVIVARSSVGSATTYANASDGSFCVAVPLAKGQENRIEVFSVHETYGSSDAAVTTLTHAGSNCQDTTTPTQTVTPTTVEQYITVVQAQSNMDRIDDTSDTDMLDGDEATYVHYEEVLFEGDWVWLQLDNSYRLAEVEIVWKDSKGLGNRFANNYYLGVATETAPGAPTEPPVSGIIGSEAAQGTTWTYLMHHNDSTSPGGTESIDLGSTEPKARHIALWLVDDAAGVSVYNHFAIAEIRVKAITDSTTVYGYDNSQQDVCANSY